jgi:hypothetical protein
MKDRERSESAPAEEIAAVAVAVVTVATITSAGAIVIENIIANDFLSLHYI